MATFNKHYGNLQQTLWQHLTNIIGNIQQTLWQH